MAFGVRLAIAAVVCITISGAAIAASAPVLPSAFLRPAVATDQLPSSVFPDTLAGESRPYDSRRIATFKGTKRTWTVYVDKTLMRGFKQKHASEHTCVFVFEGGGGGGGCSPTASFFRANRQVVASSSRVLAGVASNRVARVVVIGSRGVAHEVPLSPDHGFVYNCRAYNGCACVVSRLQAFDKMGRRITNQDWVGSRSCRRR